VSAPTAYAPLPSLLLSLRRAGWGDLTGREWQGLRSTLDGLASLLPHGSGQGWATAEQVATSAGLSSRWVRTRLAQLEAMGVIEWRRGGIVAGKPAPSWFRIAKAVLVELIRAARPMKDVKDAARRVATHARIAAARALRRPEQRSRRSAHAELNGSLPTPTGEDSRPSSPPVVLRTTATAHTAYITATCEHDGEVGRCPMCRRKASAA